MTAIIKLENVSKSYKEIKAVVDLSMEVRPQELFAFIGPNGAGKSTTIDMLCTYLKPDQGSIEINGLKIGRDDDAIRQIIGVIHQKSILDNLLTVKDNLRIRAGIAGLRGSEIDKTVNRVSEITNIKEFLKQEYGKLSGGQRRRVDIARGLLVNPKILFLDEPTTGLDPQSRNNIWQFIKDLQQSTGITVFLTTHYLEEAAQANYVVIIDHGKVAAQGTPQQLREQYTHNRLLLDTSNVEYVRNYLQDKHVEFTEHNKEFVVKLQATKDAIPMVQVLSEQINSFEVIKGTLDDAFLDITGKEIR